MKRVNNPAKYLKGVVEYGEPYCIGFGATRLTNIAKSSKDISNLVDGRIETLIATGKKGALRENTRGKYRRKEPNKKTSIWKHIEYYSNHHNRTISYDREYNIWEKELIHKYNLELSSALTPQKELILHFPFFEMEDNEEHFHKAGAAMNMAVLLGGYFMIYDSNYEPIIPVTKFKDTSILPPGEYANVDEKIEIIENAIHSDKKNENYEGNSYRFATLKELEPDDVIMGAGGFNEYLIFEFNENDLLVFENLKTGNATYMFRKSLFNANKEINKQSAKKEPSFLGKIDHTNMEIWNSKLRKHFNNINK